MADKKISKQTKSELLELLRQRYQRATKPDKGKILDEFVAVAGCHRKHAIRLLTAAPAVAVGAPVVARRTYVEPTLADMMQKLVDAGHGDRRVSCQTPCPTLPWWGWQDFGSVRQALTSQGWEID